jgi:homoserine kinase
MSFSNSINQMISAPIDLPVQSVTARAPASVANLAVGFDILGLSMDQLYDQVTLTKIKEPKVVISSITDRNGTELSKLSCEAANNTAGKPLLELIKRANLPFGFEVQIIKGIPLSSGLGGSAASAVASAMAASGFFIGGLPVRTCMELALKGEAVASGVEHADNVAPSLLGGLIASVAGPHYVSVPVPADFHILLIHPNQELETKKARAVLPAQVPFGDAIAGLSNIAGFLSGLFAGDTGLALRHLEDVLVLPYRRRLIEDYDRLAAIVAKTTTSRLHISGAGPTLFVANQSRERLQKIKKEIEDQFRIDCYLQSGPARGAIIVEKKV